MVHIFTLPRRNQSLCDPGFISMRTGSIHNQHHKRHMHKKSHNGWVNPESAHATSSAKGMLRS